MTYSPQVDGRLVSLLVPCYNEAATIDAMLDCLEALAPELAKQSLRVEIVAVDDASTDGTAERLRRRQAACTACRLVLAFHERNGGKGQAIQTAREHASGDIVVIQDADLEYDPADIPRLIAPLLAGRADAVLGSRFLGTGETRVLYFWHRVANGALTLLSNMLTDINLTDMEVGYKAFTREAFRNMYLTSRRFGIEPEIVARLAQMRARIYEVPISYHGRTYAEGKKITWRDGVAAFFHILRARLTAHRQPQLARAMETPSRPVPAAPPAAVEVPAR